MTSASQRLLCPTLVGREQELARLADALDAVARHNGRAVLVGGDAGIGKSALIRRFGELARGRGARVLVGECVEIEARRPLGPFAEIVDSARRSGLVRDQDTGAMSPSGRNQADDTSRSRMYQGHARILASLSKTSPLVVAIEDLHWADEATLELFPYLARRVGFERMLLIGTYRTDELHRRHPLRAVLADLHRLRLADEVVLTRLDNAAVGTFIRETLRLDRPPSQAFRDAVDARCEGNPFFMEEVLEALHRRGALAFTDGRWHRAPDAAEFVIPDSIRDAVEARVAYLPAEARRLLQIAAVIGQRFEFDVLREASDMPSDQLIEILRAAIDSQILVTPDSGGTFAFRHALTREAVLADLLEPERRAWHLVIGAALERRANAPARAEELAFHFDAGGDRERAFRYHLAAADLARDVAAFARAADHLERAIVLASASEDLAALYDGLGEVAGLVSAARAARANEEAWRRFSAAGDMLRAGNALSRLAVNRRQLDDPACLDVAEDAVRVLEPLGETRELAAAYGDLARNYILNGQVDQGISIAKRAVDLARAIGWTERELDARITLALLSSDDVATVVALLRDAIHTGRRQGFPALVSRAYLNLIAVQMSNLIGDSRAVLKEWREFAETSSYCFPDTLLATQAWLALGEGDFDAVLRFSGECDASAHPAHPAGAQLHEAVVRAAREGPAAAEHLILDAERHAARTPNRLAVAASAIELYLFAGDAARALERANPTSEAIRDDRGWGPTKARVIVAALSAANLRGDREARERWTSVAEALRVHGAAVRLGALYADGEAAAERGDVKAAIGLLDEVARGFDETSSPLGATCVRLRLVEVLNSYDRATALAELGKVVTFWRKGRAVWYLRELERWTRTRGLPFPRDVETERVEVAPTAKALTAREREVARFIAEGLTNKEIADRLIISERTAEGHVQRILDKLGFRSRAQVAAWFAEGRVQVASRG